MAQLQSFHRRLQQLFVAQTCRDAAQMPLNWTRTSARPTSPGPLTCDGVFIVRRWHFGVGRADLVVDAPDDGAGDLLHAGAAHVELDAF